MASIPRFDRNNLKKTYEVLRGLDKKDWDVDPKKVGEFLTEALGTNTKDSDSATKRDIGIFGKILARAAHACTEEEFCVALETGEVPPLKLSTEEMNMLRGGGCGSIAATVLTGGVSNVVQAAKGGGGGGVIGAIATGGVSTVVGAVRG